MIYNVSSFAGENLNDVGKAITKKMNQTTPTRVVNNILGRRVGHLALGISMIVANSIDTVAGLVLAVPAVFNKTAYKYHL